MILANLLSRTEQNKQVNGYFSSHIFSLREISAISMYYLRINNPTPFGLILAENEPSNVPISFCLQTS
jgi:hypothetical protein